EKIQAAKANGVRFIQLQFTDILGIVKGVTIPIHQMEGSVRHGTWFDGSSIEGFTRIAESDQYLMPDMATFAEIPWQRGAPRHGPRHLRRVHPARRAVPRRPPLRAPPPGRAGQEAGLHREHRPRARVLPLPARRGWRDPAAAPRSGRLLRLLDRPRPGDSPGHGGRP